MNLISTELRLTLTAVAGFLSGILIASGHLNPSNADMFQTDFTTLGGTALMIISLIYALEHQLIKVKNDLSNKQLDPQPLPPGVTPPPAA